MGALRCKETYSFAGFRIDPAQFMKALGADDIEFESAQRVFWRGGKQLCRTSLFEWETPWSTRSKVQI